MTFLYLFQIGKYSLKTRIPATPIPPTRNVKIQTASYSDQWLLHIAIFVIDFNVSPAWLLFIRHTLKIKISLLPDFFSLALMRSLYHHQ